MFKSLKHIKQVASAGLSKTNAHVAQKKKTITGKNDNKNFKESFLLFG